MDEKKTLPSVIEAGSRVVIFSTSNPTVGLLDGVVCDAVLGAL